MKKALLKLTEADIQRTVVDLLIVDGWRPIRTEHAIERHAGGKFKRKVGEAGMPDYLFVRYPSRISLGWSIRMPPDCHVLWIEFKATGETPSPSQLSWHGNERLRGALVIVVDDIEAFRRWYAASGLQGQR